MTKAEKAQLLETCPTALINLREYIEAEVVRTGVARKEFLKQRKSELGEKAFNYRFAFNDQAIMYKSEREIRENAREIADNTIASTLARTYKITGEVTDWSNVRLAHGSNNTLILNGRVDGANGSVHLESIGAGGYNIQKFHIRVLVKKIEG